MSAVLRSLILSVFVGLTAFAAARELPQTPPSTGIIRVAVRVSGSLEPLAGANVTVNGQSTPPYSATMATGADGVAVFDKLPSVNYTVRVVSDGYSYTPPASGASNPNPSLAALLFVASTAFAGPSPADVSVLLATNGSLSGRVLDAYGVPMPNARVTIGTIGYNAGRRVFQPQATAQPDGFGNYEVAPRNGWGEFYVRLELLTPQGLATYYPGVSDIDDAIRVPVKPGQQVVGIDFKMTPSKTYKVSGNVLNLPAPTQPNGPFNNTVQNFSFMSADPHKADSQAAPLLLNARRGSNGEFELSLPTGLWDIFPVISLRTLTAASLSNSAAAGPQPTPSQTPTYATGRVRVLVADRDVENVSVTIAATAIQGRIVTEGDTQTPILNSIRVSLIPIDSTPAPLLSNIRVAQNLGQNDSFSFGSVPPGRYNLDITPIPNGYYVADIRVGTKSIFDDGIIHTGADPIEPIEVTLRRGGGTVEVRAPRPPSRPVASGTNARVVLVPSGTRSQNALLFKSLAVPLSAGVFANIAPGEYKIFAFEDLPIGGAERNNEFMDKYQRFGVPVHVDAGQNQTVNVSWIPEDQ